jgi:hypothetical protein
MHTQKETRALTRAIYHEWAPQLFVDEHQMGSSGPRMFIPPFSDPLDPDVHPLIWREVNLVGSTMAFRLEQARKPGVIYGYQFDAYWVGGTRNTGWWKNITGLLLETASARMATPIYIDPTELAGGGKGLVDYKATVNHPNPWKGGLWRMRDIMDYERIASDALLETTSQHREDYLRSMAVMAQASTDLAKPEDVYRVPSEQRDPVMAAKLAHLLDEHNVEVLVDEKTKDFYVPLHQPYGRFVSEMLGTQRYPKVKPVAGSNILPPYDVAAWSLPLMMGVSVDKATVPSDRQKLMRRIGDKDWPQGGQSGKGEVYAVTRDTNASAALVNAALKAKAKVTVTKQALASGSVSYPAGTYIVEGWNDAASTAAAQHLRLTAMSSPKVSTTPLREPRLALYKPWTSNMDEGWTRFVLEQYGFNYKSIDNKAVKAGNLRASYDAIIVPDMDKDLIIEGKFKPREGEGSRYFPELPPEYSGGIGREGVQALKKFVEDGGTLITLASAGELVTDEFNVPVRNTLARARAEDFSCPGSLLRLKLDTAHPIAWGMPSEIAAFVDEGIAYQTSVPGSELDRSVIGWYPDEAEDILLSGWIRGADKLTRKSAVVSFTQGKGKIVLLGFRVQQRAQTEGTFKLLFNSIYWSVMDEGAPAAAAGK